MPISHDSIQNSRYSHPIIWLASHYHPITKEPYLGAYEEAAFGWWMKDFEQIKCNFRLQKWTDITDKISYDVNRQYVSLPIRKVRERLQKISNLMEDYLDFMVDACIMGRKLSSLEKKYHFKRGEAKNIIKKNLLRLYEFYQTWR